MNRFVFLVFLLVVLSVHATAQTIDFPAGFGAVPKTKLKGSVHTVLTVEQRGEKVFSTVVEVYDLNGKLIETLSTNAGIEVHSNSLVRLGGKSTYDFDASGKLIKERQFTPEGKYTGYETFTYDRKNRLIGSILYDTDGKETGKKHTQYFPEKRGVEVTWNFYFDGRIPPPNKNLLAYDEKGRWTKRTDCDSKGAENGFVTFEYDSDGNFVKDVHCCKYNYSHRYSYKFDKQGNWIERQNTSVQLDENGKEETDPTWMHTYRVITYYSDSQTTP